MASFERVLSECETELLHTQQTKDTVQVENQMDKAMDITRV